jgi:hypothetical protein
MLRLEQRLSAPVWVLLRPQLLHQQGQTLTRTEIRVLRVPPPPLQQQQQLFRPRREAPTPLQIGMAASAQRLHSLQLRWCRHRQQLPVLLVAPPPQLQQQRHLAVAPPSPPAPSGSGRP